MNFLPLRPGRYTAERGIETHFPGFKYIHTCRYSSTYSHPSIHPSISTSRVKSIIPFNGDRRWLCRRSRRGMQGQPGGWHPNWCCFGRSRWTHSSHWEKSTNPKRQSNPPCKPDPTSLIHSILSTLGPSSSFPQAEIAALENAGRLPAATYRGATMYTTLSPCDMCTGACILYKVRRVVIGRPASNYMSITHSI